MNPDQVRQILGQCLEFEQIRRSGHLARFLTFVVEQTLAGNESGICESSIAVEALGRDEDFDPRIDPVVRVVAGRLRRALEMYALTEGVGDSVRIVLPKGSYVPRFESAVPRADTQSGASPPAPLTPITIVLVDDHIMLRRGLRVLLDAEPGFRVIGESDDGAGLPDLVRTLKPDIVVMDISMPGTNGIEATGRLGSEFPDTRVVALSVHAGQRFVGDMLRAGARGYVLKESAPEELVTAIRAVANGDIYLSPSVTKSVVSRFVAESAKAERPAPLSEDQRTLLRLLAEGFTAQDLADELRTTRIAVERTIEELIDRLGVENVDELTSFAEGALKPR